MTGKALKAAAICLALISAFPRPAAASEAASAVCAAEVARHERAQGIPAHLLKAISIVESGRWDAERKASIAWPWTVMAEGKGRFLPSKDAAIAEVRALKARGVRNIDVGCMQVNLRHHPTAFANIEEAFDPAANVAYAARFLRALYDNTNNWPVAASYYHSQTPSLAAIYRGKLMVAWDAAKAGKAPGATVLASLNDGQPKLGKTQTRESTLTPQAQSLVAQRTEARKIAEAYRQARIAEYNLRRASWASAGGPAQ